MTITPDPFEALTVPGELNAIPWTENDEDSESVQPLSLGLDDNSFLFQDTMPLDGEVPIRPPIL
jgi:hypothetical protein